MCLTITYFKYRMCANMLEGWGGMQAHELAEKSTQNTFARNTLQVAQATSHTRTICIDKTCH